VKNLLALVAGMTVATLAINWWIKREVKICGLVSGGQQILPPKGD
jgi:hypothetical protein